MVTVRCFATRRKSLENLPATAKNTDWLTPDNAALLMVDHQTGISNGVADQSIPEFNNNVMALAKVAKVYNLQTVFTTSAGDGPNGSLLPGLTDILPDAPIIRRPGEINAWNNKDFVAAVKKTERKKLIVAGISTEVCVAFVALPALRDGRDVYAVIDASGTWSKLIADTAVQRMTQAGVVPITWIGVAAELQADWRKPTGQGLAKCHGVILSTETPSPVSSRRNENNATGSTRI
jgi:nicotinamidase-related amidase